MGIKNEFGKANPKDDRFGRVDVQGIYRIAEGEGMRSEPKAVLTLYTADAQGHMKWENKAFTQPELANFITSLRNQVNDPDNHNPHKDDNLKSVVRTAYALNDEMTRNPAFSEAPHILADEVNTIGGVGHLVENMNPTIRPTDILPASFKVSP